MKAAKENLVSQIATVQARGGKRYIVATNSNETNEQLLDRTGTVRVVKRVNTRVNNGLIEATAGLQALEYIGSKITPKRRRNAKRATQYTCYHCGKGIKGRSEKFASGLAFHPACYQKVEREAERELNKIRRRNSVPSEYDFDADDQGLLDESARMGTQQARALGRASRKELREPKFFDVTWYSSMRGKRTGFVRPIEADSAADAKRQAKAMIMNEKPINIVAKLARKRNPHRSYGKVSAKRSVATTNLFKKRAFYIGRLGQAALLLLGPVSRLPNSTRFRSRKEKHFIVHQQALIGGRWVSDRKPVMAADAKEAKEAAREDWLYAGGGDESDTTAGGWRFKIGKAERVTPEAWEKAKRQRNPNVSQKIARLTAEGMPHSQAVAVAFSEKRVGKVNPSAQVHLAKADGTSLCGAGKRWESSEITTTKGLGRVTCQRCLMLARKRNPSAREMSERFQGAASGIANDLKASDLAPANLSRAGKLVFLRLADNRKALRISGAVVAIDPRSEKLWIVGDRVPLLNRKANAKGTLADCGEVVQICYETAKKHIGNGKRYEYVHEFGEDGGKRPHLMIDHEGMPVLRGGDYKIKAEGIVN